MAANFGGWEVYPRVTSSRAGLIVRPKRAMLSKMNVSKLSFFKLKCVQAVAFRSIFCILRPNNSSLGLSVELAMLFWDCDAVNVK